MSKRVSELFLVLLAMPAWLPALLITALATRILIGTPVFFRQQRPGLHGRPFHMLKFRTMTNERDAFGRLLPDEKRLTRFGSFLRSTSLDELPSLLNLVRGDLSLVGPRPLLMQYLPLYSAEQARRHDVRPGITGWAQVNGRNTPSWEEKFAMDIWYVENRSAWLDLKILFLTALSVVRREGINQQGSATMPPFTGSG